MKRGRGAVAALLMVPVALGSLRIAVGGHGSGLALAQIPVVIISTSLPVASQDRKTLFNSYVRHLWLLTSST